MPGGGVGQLGVATLKAGQRGGGLRGGRGAGPGGGHGGQPPPTHSALAPVGLKSIDDG